MDDAMISIFSGTGTMGTTQTIRVRYHAETGIPARRLLPTVDRPCTRCTGAVTIGSKRRGTGNCSIQVEQSASDWRT